MELILSPVDLKPEFQTLTAGGGVDQSISTFEVTYDKLNASARTAVRVAGRARYYSWDRKTYNFICYLPKKK